MEDQQHFQAQSCGVCTFGAAPAGPVSSAGVLSFSQGDYAGADGIMQYIHRLSSNEQLHSATAYCEKCRKITWLCASGSSLDDALTKFHYNTLRARTVNNSIEIARKLNGA